MNEIQEAYNIESIRIEAPYMDIVKELVNVEIGKGLSYQIIDVLLNGYLNDEEPFAICRTNDAGNFLATHNFSLQLAEGNYNGLIKSNKTGSYISNDECCIFENGELQYSGKLFTNLHNANIEKGSQISENLRLHLLSYTNETINNNLGLNNFSKAQEVFGKEELFHILIERTIDNNNIQLQFAYESAESYKKGGLPIVIVGAIDFSKENIKGKRYVDFIRNDSGQYESIRHNFCFPSYDSAYQIPTYSEYQQFMNSLGLKEIPITETFENMSKGLPEPNIVNAVRHIRIMQQVLRQDPMPPDLYVADMDGICITMMDGKGYSCNKQLKKQLKLK